MSKSKLRVPHTLVLLVGMIVLAYVSTLFLPQGAFERITNEAGREQVVPGSYEGLEEANRLGPQTIFTAIPKGFEEAADIIFFVFIVGGMFGVFRATGAADAAIGALLQRLGGRTGLFIFGAMALFAAGSATIGMAEEYLPFVPLLVALALALGLDTMTAIGTMCIGYGVGYGAALINPFTVFIAQDVAGIEQGSALTFRLILLLVFLLVGFHHVLSYARKVKADPASSLVADIEPDPSMVSEKHPVLTGRHILVLSTMLVTIGILIWGLKTQHWYLVEMGAFFSALSIVIAVIAGMGADQTARQFCVGAAELTTTALLIGFARAIQVVLDEGQVVDTIVNAIAAPLQSLGPQLAAVGMFMVQSLCNLFIPSGSGQAYVTMPIMAPLADLVGVSRQIAVLAFQFGDGFTNILVPTNAVLVGILAMARIPYDRWLRFVLPFMVKIWVVGSIALVVAVILGVQ